MLMDFIWFLSGFLLVAFGILHEMCAYWLQLRRHWYTRQFGQHGFTIHGLQLGGTWILIASFLTILFWEMPAYPFHKTLFFVVLGGMAFVGGIGLMLASWHALGSKRVMKSRLFVSLEPPWVTTGIFRHFPDPMYRGSQLAMLGLAFALDSWILVIYAVEMWVLQHLLAKLEKAPVEKQV